ncbi:MAG: polysaccharide biosynthesis/export family protein [Candidatus Anammoxibacter sp.]
MTNKIVLALSIIILFVHTGCSSFDKIPTNVILPEGGVKNRLEAINGKYKLSPPDVITISVDDNPGLALTATIRPDGNIYFPLLGDVYVEGLSPLEIRKKIHGQLGKYLRDIPEEAISVGVVGFNSKVVYVYSFGVGLIQIPFTGDLTVLGAITQSGLLVTTSNEKKITIIRGESDPDKRPQRLVLNLNDITRKGITKKNIVLRPRDIVYIPATFGARIGMAVQNLLFPVQPVQGLGAAAASAQVGGFGFTDPEAAFGAGRGGSLGSISR